MKFDIRTIGIFEVISSKLEGGEVYDSAKLQKTAGFLIKNDVRNLIIDFGDIEYLYSDAINVVFNTNRQMLKVSGRLGILANKPEVQSVITKAGLENMMRVYHSEAEVLDDSQEILRQLGKFQGDGSRVSEQIQLETEEPEPGLDSLKTGIEESLSNMETGLESQQGETGTREPSPAEESGDPNLIPLAGEETAQDEKPEAEEAAEPSSIDLEPVPDLSADESVIADSPAYTTLSDEKEKQLPDKTPQARLGPKDRLRSPAGRTRSSGPRRKLTEPPGGTGLILTDDTVAGEVISKKEDRPRSVSPLVKEKRSKPLSLVFGLILIVAIIGGLLYLLKESSITRPKEPSVEKPYVPSKAREAEARKDELQQEPVEEIEPVTPAEEKTELKPGKKRPSKKAPAKKDVIKEFKIISNPSRALVLVNYTKKGLTPLKVPLPKKLNKIIIKKKGYKNFEISIPRSTSQEQLVVNLEELAPVAKKSVAPRKKAAPEDREKAAEAADKKRTALESKMKAEQEAKKKARLKKQIKAREEAREKAAAREKQEEEAKREVEAE
ncbi:STAS domain-containing protein, partial [Fibrobacterota bacterium]